MLCIKFMVYNLGDFSLVCLKCSKYMNSLSQRCLNTTNPLHLFFFFLSPRSTVSTAPAVTSTTQKQALTKNQRKKLKKKLKKALQQNTTSVAPEDGGGGDGGVTLNSTTEHAQKMGVELTNDKGNADDAIKGLGPLLGEKLVLTAGEELKFFATPENGLVDIMETSITSAVLTTRDHLTAVEREKSEVSTFVADGVGEGGVVCEEEEGAEEGEGGEEDGEVDVSRWGALKVPVTVKIADLGNACWVVSLLCVCVCACVRVCVCA